MASEQIAAEWVNPTPIFTSRAWYDPTRPTINLLATGGAALILACIGLLVNSGALPWINRGSDTMDFALLLQQGEYALLVQFFLTIVTSLLLPFIALLVWRRYQTVRMVLVPFILVVIAQAICEGLYMQLFFPSMATFTGLLFSTFRMWQLYELQKFFGAQPQPLGWPRRVVRGLLVIGIGFWLYDFFVLSLIRMPKIIEL